MEISVQDHGDNTGATVSVTNNSGTATIYLSRFAGTNASRAFASYGTIAGDSTLVLPSLDIGPYVAMAVNSLPELTAPVFFRVSDLSDDAIHYRLLEAIREYVLSLALPKVSTDPDDHVIVKMPYRPDLELNFDGKTNTCVMYFPKPETYDPTTNETSTIAYSVQVLLVRKIGTKLFTGLADMLKDREIMGRSLSISPLPDLDCIHTVQIQPGAIYLPEQWQKSYDASSMVFRCLTEQDTGVM